MNPLDLAIIFLTLGITEAVIKPIAKRFVQRRILKAAPAILRAIDAPPLVTVTDQGDK